MVASDFPNLSVHCSVRKTPSISLITPEGRKLFFREAPIGYEILQKKSPELSRECAKLVISAPKTLSVVEASRPLLNVFSQSEREFNSKFLTTDFLLLISSPRVLCNPRNLVYSFFSSGRRPLPQKDLHKLLERIH